MCCREIREQDVLILSAICTYNAFQEETWGLYIVFQRKTANYCWRVVLVSVCSLLYLDTLRQK
jgi:hypothetical protein